MGLLLKNPWVLSEYGLTCCVSDRPLGGSFSRACRTAAVTDSSVTPSRRARATKAAA